LKVGILSFQGSFLDHSKSVSEIGFHPLLIKQSKDLDSIDALILPGGESTAMKKINDFSGLLGNVDEIIKDGTPTLTTCAGTILLAKEVIDGDETIPNIDIEVIRNAYGRQAESFEGSVKFFENEDIYCFIRAPKISKILSDEVNIIAEHNDEIVGAAQKNVVALTFHPELNNDDYYLNWLYDFIQEGKNVRSL
tara:strand:+ start:412 stop:993 length:582 start_codon:yes stop_codon:yes gene_type:complete